MDVLLELDALLAGHAPLELLALDVDALLAPQLAVKSAASRPRTAPDKPSDSSDASPPKARAKHRDRKKEELQYLRQRSRELEDQLKALTGGKPAKRSRKTDESELMDLSWRSIALRQQSKRQRAEAENRKLKTVLEEYVLAAQRLQAAVYESVRGQKALKNPRLNRLTWGPDDLTEVQQLSREVKAEHARLDVILMDLELRRRQRGGAKVIPDEELGFAFVKAVPLSIGSGDIYLDLESTSMIPFPFDRVCDTAWPALRSLFIHGSSLSRSSGIEIEADDDCRLVMKLPCYSRGGFINPDGPEGEGNCVLVLEKFVEKNRMAIVWRGIGDDPAQSPNMITDSTGWCVFEPSSSSTTAGTMVRGCVHVIPIAKDPIRSQTKQEVCELADRLMGSLANDLKALKGGIEDALLHEAMQYEKKVAQAEVVS